MTYDEIKKRLTEVETALQSMQNKKSAKLETSYTAKSIGRLTTIKESLEKQLAEKDETMFISTKGGDTKAVAMDRKSAMDLKKDPNITGIDTAKGQKIKEQDGVKFSVEETKAIAKSVGKGLLKALKQAGDEVARIKAHRIEENSFDIHIVYKGEKGEDEFSFYISDDSLHLVDFSFDKELVDVGVKPSGEAIVNVDVLANELLKHFKSLNEGYYDKYEPKHFDICPGATSLRDRVIDGEFGEQMDVVVGKWTELHDNLFRLEKAVIKANKAQDAHVRAANQFRDEIIHLSRDMNIPEGEIGYLKGHVKKIEDIANGVVKEGEGDDHHYIKVPRREYKSAMQILNRNAEPSFVKMDTVDDDGMGNVIIYFMFNEFADDFDVEEREAFMYDAVEDLKAHGIDVQDHSAQLDEARDINDPVAIRVRAARMKRDKFAGSDPKAGSTIKSRGFDPIILKLKAKRAQIMRDMEQEAEPEGGPIADKYGDMLNKIDAAIAKARGLKEGQPTVFDDESMDALRDIILKYVEDPDDAEKFVQQVDDHGLDSLPDHLEAQLERDPEFEAWYHKLHYGNDADTDYMQRRRAEKDYQQESALGFSDIEKLGSKAASDIDISVRRDPNYTFGKRPGDDARLRYKYAKQLGYLEENEGDDLDVGHQDDEPGMLKSTSYEIATYAAKLYKKLAKYDQVDGEVDFPNWWQSKLILAKDYVSKAYHYLDSEEKQPIIDKLALEHALSEGTELYDRNGINIKRFSGGKRGLMVQVTYGGEYIQIPADEFPILARAMQSVIGDLRDMNVQYPRSKNVGEALDSEVPKNASAAKLQKAHGMIVDKMKELAKLYKEKGGDHEYRGHSVIDHLKSLTKKKKQVEAALEKAVAGIGKGQELTEVTEDEVQDAIMELRNLIDEIEAKGEEAREVVRQVFPNELSRLDAYGAFNNMYSANRYDVTLGGFVDRLEEEGFEIEDGEVFTNEGMTVVGHTPEEQKKNAEELVAKAKELGIEAKIRYNDNPGYEDHINTVDIGPNGIGSHPELDAIQDRQFAEYDKNKPKDNKSSFKPKKLKKLKLGGKTYEIGDFDPNDDGRIESIEKYPNGYYITGGIYSDYGDGDAPKEGYGYAIDLKGNEMDEEDLEGMYEGKYKSDAQRKAIYAAKAEKNESFKVGDKVTYLGHPGEITKVNKEMTGAITYNVAYDKGNGRTKVTNIYNKGGEIKAVKEALQLVHVYDKDGKMYGTGSVEKVEGDKTTVRFDGSTVKRFPSDRVKPVKEAELSKDEKKKLKDMSKSLKKSTKGHAAQAKYLDKLVKEQKATCCGRCGRVHVKGTKCKSPYLKGKDHCRYN